MNWIVWLLFLFEIVHTVSQWIHRRRQVKRGSYASLSCYQCCCNCSSSSSSDKEEYAGSGGNDGGIDVDIDGNGGSGDNSPDESSSDGESGRCVGDTNSNCAFVACDVDDDGEVVVDDVVVVVDDDVEDAV
jgi:hypothetical protein